jgi:hypothetical protein
MKRELTGAFLGSLVFFVWGFVYWAVLPIGPIVFRQADDEVALARQIQLSIKEPGSYMVPGMELMTSNGEEYTRRHEAGPRATLFVYPQGRPVMSPMSLLGGFATMFASVFVMALVLRMAAQPRYAARVGIVILGGSTGTFLGDLGFPFWYDWPWLLWLASAAFHLSGWVLTAVIVAAVVRPKTKIQAG